MMTEEPVEPDVLATLEPQVRAGLVKAAAMAALADSGCRETELFLPLVLRNLKALHVGFGEFGVFATDAGGEVRVGPGGEPMTPDQLVQEIRADPGFQEIGWQPRTHYAR